MQHAICPPPLDAATRDRLASFVQDVGERRAILLLETSRPTLSRALAGLPVRRATAEIIRLRLASATVEAAR